MCSTLRMKVPDLSLTDSCTFMNCILSSSSSSLHPMSSMTSSSTSSSSQHHCKNWLSSGRLRVKQPLAINASPFQVYKYVLKYDIFYVFGLGQIYIFDLIWFAWKLHFEICKISHVFMEPFNQYMAKHYIWCEVYEYYLIVLSFI